MPLKNRLCDLLIKILLSFSLFLQNYNLFLLSTGIFECSGSCSCVDLNHAVTVVGYTPTYWNVRNSWGERWGDGGYVKMSRKQENVCLINEHVMKPVLKCKEGVKCNGELYDAEDEDEDDSGDEYDKNFDFGKIIKHGEIEHQDGFCVDMDDTVEKLAVLSTTGCSREFAFTNMGYIVDVTTKLCLTADFVYDEEQKLRFEKCGHSERWEFTKDRFQLWGRSHLFWHSHGSSGHKKSGTCEDDSCLFKFTKNRCWEVKNGFRMEKLLWRVKRFRFDCPRELEEAKEACLEARSCTGIYIRDGVCRIYQDEKPFSKGNRKDKVIVRVACDDSCEIGKQRCLDGECRRKCDE